MSEWISVNDRLPLTRKDLKNGSAAVEVLVWNGLFVYLDDFSIGDKPKFWTHFNMSNVTHWMPLPAPPKNDNG